MKTLLRISLLCGLAAGIAHADVMVKRSVTTEGIGMFGGAPKEMTQWYGPERQREETHGSGKPSLFEKMAGTDKPRITRLDKKVVWTLNIPKKKYEERPLVGPLDKKEESAESGEESEAGPAEKPTTRISKAEFKVVPLGKKKTIGAYVCEGYEVRALIETENLESHEKSEMKMVTTLWNAPETGAVAQLKKEETAYAQAYAKAIGITDDVKSNMKLLGGSMVAMLAGSGEKELSKALAGMPAELKKVKGYPISTRVEWFGKDPGGAEAAAKPEEENIEIPTDVSSALGSLASGFAKKKLAPKPPTVTKDGRVLFAMTTEVTTIATAALPADTFEIPSGFTPSR